MMSSTLHQTAIALLLLFSFNLFPNFCIAISLISQSWITLPKPFQPTFSEYEFTWLKAQGIISTSLPSISFVFFHALFDSFSYLSELYFIYIFKSQIYFGSYFLKYIFDLEAFPIHYVQLLAKLFCKDSIEEAVY